MPSVTLLWVWMCAYLNGAGWALSAVHELNAPGYAAVLLLGLGMLLVWRKQTGTRLGPRIRWPGLRRRFRRSFPLAFLVLAGMAFLGGVIHSPSNYDALAYRIPRVLHWLAAGQWHWIHTLFPRLNARSCGIEWVSAPVLALTHTDRLLFLINTVSCLLLPGLVYSVFWRLGVRRRVAWHWMWLAPTGYGFLLQSGGLGNDLFGAAFALAAVDFALRAKATQSTRCFYASLLAAALMTSAKTSSLPLLLPWALALLPAWRLLFQKPLWSAAAGLLALAASFLPTAILNAHYAHDWTGTKAEVTSVRSDPPLRTAANLTLLTVQNLVPPVFPLAGVWNRAVHAYLPTHLSLRLHQTMVEPQAAEFKLEEMQMEENAGLGFGVSMLLIVSVLAAVWSGGGGFLRLSFPAGEDLWLTALRWSPLVCVLVLASQSGIAALARVLTPYYLLVLPALLVAPAQERLTRRTWWRGLAAVVFLLAGGLLFISPARPLFPAVSLFAAVQARHPQSPLLGRMKAVYRVYHDRNEAFAPALAALPPNLGVLGLFTYDDPETSLWRPFGSRRIEHVRPEDTVDDLTRRGIRYVLIPEAKLQTWFRCPPEDWVHRLGAEVIQKIPLPLRVSDGLSEWWLVKLP